MSQPNILFLVFDACRAQELYEVGGTFSELVTDNVHFQRAAAPSAWSLPSHVSFLTGSHPSEHGVCTEHAQKLPELSVLDTLAEEGYRTSGVSANAYFSPAYQFDAAFDQFFYTMDSGVDDGLDISESLRHANQQGLNKVQKYTKLFANALKHDAPLQSLRNLLRAGINKTNRHFPIHPRFESSHGYRYSAKWNTNHIEKIIRKSSDSEPFFVVANYMDAHFPYYPREKYSMVRELFQYRLDYAVNERTGHPFKFHENVATDTVRESDIAHIKNLYRKEIETLDDHLGQILSTLVKAGSLDNTLIIVTADHGENLGEVDDRGYRRMGHHESVSDMHLNVPLLIAHPQLKAKTVREPVETRNLASVIGQLRIDSERIVDILSGSGNYAVVESPAHKKLSLREKYPDLSDEFYKRFSHEHSVVVYNENWKVANCTDGSWFAWKDGASRDIDDAPQVLRKKANQHIEKLTKTEPLTEIPEETNPSNDVAEQLADLGYV